MTRNKLPEGITAADVVRAIGSSGYPLQLHVAAQLSSYFEITEEWGYVDRISDKFRTLDLRAYRFVRGDQETVAEKVFPGIDLLIECKRGDLPYVFLSRESAGAVSPSPRYEGLSRQSGRVDLA